jgi:hypothetical protein
MCLKRKIKGYVYLMQALETNRYKIGITRKNPLIRQQQLNRCQNAYEIKLICYKYSNNCTQIESDLHFKYANQNIRGEWFVFTPSLYKKVVKDIMFPQVILRKTKTSDKTNEKSRVSIKPRLTAKRKKKKRQTVKKF